MSVFRFLILLLGLVAFPCAPGMAENSNSDCLDCHGEPDITAKRDGQKVSVFVDDNLFKASVHKELKCITCHKDVADTDLPHRKRLKPANCTQSCHDQEQKLFSGSVHGQALAKGDPLAPICQNCHGNHAILPVTDENSAVSPLRIPFVCGSCHSEGSEVQLQRNIHQDHILQNYSESIHGEGLFKKGLSVSATCVSCHNSHEILSHTESRSSIAKDNVVKTCSKCHAQIKNVHRKVIDGALWEKEPERVPVCVECHQPHKARKVFYDQGVADKDCLFCHAKPEIKSTVDGRSLFVNGDEVKGSTHTNVACAQCHSEVTPSHERACETIKNKVNCATCHSGQMDDYNQSVHGKLHAENNPDAPACLDCHGTHGIKNKKALDSPTYPTNVPNLCARCHQESGKAAVHYKGLQHNITTNYEESIHGKGLLKSGLVVTAMCTSCHMSHKILPASDPTSSVSRGNIAVTCSHCHKGVYEEYTRSIHVPRDDGKHKQDEFPVCKDCHTAHTIKRTDMSNFRFEIMNVCGKCHQKIADTYFDTFHGKVTKLGYAKTAKCHDCHGSHNILPVSNPHSTLSHENITNTCKTCHPSATRQFAGYLSHATHHDPTTYPWIFFTFWSMTALLVGTFAVSGIHTLLWLPRSLEMRRLHPPRAYDPSEQQYIRFNLLHRILHGTMIVSFLTLAITGMTLKFSYARWALFVSRALGGFEVTGFLHRVAAVALVAVFSIHIWDLFRRKREEFGSWKIMLLGPDTILFTLKDLSELWATLKWYVGRGERPRYGRWTYWEKFDYFAVFWGVFVIGGSGLMLWFPEMFTRVLPGWLINVATIIHSDEALLAAGFIFTIHFFNTHFRPEKFPMDMAIFTGRVPLEELKRERPLEYEALVAKNELEKRLAHPLPPGIVRALRIFGWTALILGLCLVVGIMYSMLFVYR